jgi:hypothetical protein
MGTYAIHVRRSVLGLIDIATRAGVELLIKTEMKGRGGRDVCWYK